MSYSSCSRMIASFFIDTTLSMQFLRILTSCSPSVI